MNKNVEIDGKTIKVEISAKAQTELENRKTPLLVEMELYFSCLIRKAMYFDTNSVATPDVAHSVQVGDNLHLSFRPVMTEICKVTVGVKAPPVTDFPIANIKPYIPRWARIDFVRGEWCGEFGYD